MMLLFVSLRRSDPYWRAISSDFASAGGLLNDLSRITASALTVFSSGPWSSQLVPLNLPFHFSHSLTVSYCIRCLFFESCVGGGIAQSKYQ